MDEKLNEDVSTDVETTPRPLPPLLKNAGIIILAAGIFLILQSFMMISMSDNTMLALVKAAAKAERDGTNPPFQFRGKSDEAIDRMVEGARSRVIDAARGEAMKFFFIKIIMAILLVITGLGIFSKIKISGKGTRRLALISGIILLLGFLASLPKMGQQLKNYNYLEGYSFLKTMDYLWSILIVLALIACFIAYGMLRTRKQ
jgi:hypothetical protein